MNEYKCPICGNTLSILLSADTKTVAIVCKNTECAISAGLINIGSWSQPASELFALHEQIEQLKEILMHCLAYFEHDANQPYLHDEPAYSNWYSEHNRLFSVAFEKTHKKLLQAVEG